MYGLVTLLGLISTICFVRLLDGRSRAFWPYALSMALTLHTMYFGIFSAAAHGVYWLIRYRWLAVSVRGSIFRAMATAGVLYLPWVIFAGPKLTAYVENKITVEGYVPLSLPTFLQKYSIAFSLGHPSEAFQPYAWVTIGFAAIAVLGWYTLRSQKRTEPNAAVLLACYLLVPLLLGWLVNLLSPFTPRFFERTLLLAAPAWWILVGVGLMWLWQRQSLIGIITISGLLLINAISLFDFYGVPRYPEEDYRPMLAEIAAISEPDDQLLASYQWQLGYYHAYLPDRGPQPYICTGMGPDLGNRRQPNEG